MKKLARMAASRIYQESQDSPIAGTHHYRRLDNMLNGYRAKENLTRLQETRSVLKEVLSAGSVVRPVNGTVCP
jgi:hypothetical protein